MARAKQKRKQFRLIGHRADNGRFIPVAEARRKPKTTVVERIPIGKK